MWDVITDWYRRYLTHPEAVILLLTLAVIIIIFKFFGAMLAPVFVSIAIAYLLNGLVERLQKWKFPHLLAVSLVCLLFIGLVLVGLFWLLPMLWQQLTNLFTEMPNMLNTGQTLLMRLPERYPAFISEEQITHITTTLKPELGNWGKAGIAYVLATIPGLIEVIVYVILVPLLVFFFLKDKQQIIDWCVQFMPRQRSVVVKVWREVNLQIGNYIRGRIIEIFLVGIISAVTFKVMGLSYAVLLGVLAGVSAIVPYIGAIIATIPIVIIALLQWGWSAHFAYLIIAYTVISIVDSNILVPLLFSETMDLHPIAIIVSVIIFGGLWGFWGVFFAIPLATVVKAVIHFWPRVEVTA